LEGQVAGWIGVCHAGPVEQGEELVTALKAFGPPTMDFIGHSDYAAQNTMFDAGAANPSRNYWRSSFVRELPDDQIDSFIAFADEMPQPASMLLIEHMGGAIGRVGEQETAFSSRSANYNVSILSSWMDAADDEAFIPWTRSAGDEIREYSDGGAYVNYMADDEGAANVRAAYEANFERLVEVKRKYDPDNFFSSNQNIRP
ncbi:MAG: BBE domain-containing protein, partial [Woeseiaceae bacterium]|nr:BBE domain-containing protein [Woeseiaceae bacterium]